MNTNQYEFLHMIYDDLMQNVDYKNWIDFVENMFLELGERPINILELGCGSGNSTIELLEKGYEVVGIDISDEMLDIAREKTFDFGNKIILLQQDITNIDFEVYEIDCILAINDTFNYITSKEELEKLFVYLYERMKKGGQFVFDISSAYKLKNILGNNILGESFDDMAYLWENYFDEETNSVTMDINIFQKEGKLYQRYTETHIQKAYEIDEMAKILEKVGFKNIKIYADFEKQSPKDNSQRIFFGMIK